MWASTLKTSSSAPSITAYTVSPSATTTLKAEAEAAHPHTRHWQPALLPAPTPRPAPGNQPCTKLTTVSAHT